MHNEEIPMPSATLTASIALDGPHCGVRVVTDPEVPHQLDTVNLAVHRAARRLARNKFASSGQETHGGHTTFVVFGLHENCTKRSEKGHDQALKELGASAVAAALKEKGVYDIRRRGC